MGGGASRADVTSLLYLRPVLVIGLFLLWLVPAARDRLIVRTRMPMILLCLFVLSIACQLVPLPPAVWQALPGYGRFTEAATIASMPQPWRPLSLAPMLTINALLAILPAAAGLYGGMCITARDQVRIMHCILITGVFSALLGAVQIGGGGTIAYTYAQTSPGLPVGLFSNRNHQAVFLAMCLPLLALWAIERRGPADRVRPWIAAGTAFFLLVMLVVTGSRAGLAIGIAAVMVSGWLVARTRTGGLRRQRMIVIAAAAGMVGLVIAIAILAGRALTIERLFALTGSADEQRLNALPTLLTMIRDFLLSGIGYGAFDPAFRMYESDAALHYTYFNHAHNDVLEMILTGGIPAILLLIAGIAWFIAAARKTARASSGQRQPWPLVSAVLVALLLGASLTDYPLRTPFLAFVFAYLVSILATIPSGTASEPRDIAC